MQKGQIPQSLSYKGKHNFKENKQREVKKKATDKNLNDSERERERDEAWKSPEIK